MTRSAGTIGAALRMAAFFAVAGCSGGGAPIGVEPPALEGPHRGLSSRVTALTSQPPAEMDIAFLMTDGSVIAQNNFSDADWYRYVPDDRGGYADGTWSKIASLPAGYAPDAFASGVLSDGRLLITGGEYNSPPNGYYLQLTNLGAVYDPVAKTWTPLGHPHGWKWIGDSPSTVLPDGSFLLGQKLTDRDAVLDPKTLSWTPVGHAGKADFNAEEGWTLLPGGTVLTADVRDAPNSEIYNPSTHKWKSAGSTIVDLHSPPEGPGCAPYGPKAKNCYYPPGEIGPSILRPDGTVFYTGSAPGPSGFGTGHTAIYHTRGAKAGTWNAGPDFPSQDNAGDSYATLEPNGNVLVFGRSGSLYEWDGATFTQVNGAFNEGAPILLPTGQVLMLGGYAALYTPPGMPKAAWAPAIKSYPKRIRTGKTYRITGTQFNGLSQAMSFGDEFQNSTNYPLVRITNDATGRVFYARTHDHSTMAVATGSKRVWTYFDVPRRAVKGPSTLAVVANGVASKAVRVMVI